MTTAAPRVACAEDRPRRCPLPGAEATPRSPPPALAPQENLPHPNQVVVAKGETLYTISRRYDVPLRSIIDANHLDPPFQVAAGTKLDLPQERFHTVKQGETLYGISRNYGVEVSTLASLNRLSEPYTLYRPAKRLELPALGRAGGQDGSHRAATRSGNVDGGYACTKTRSTDDGVRSSAAAAKARSVERAERSGRAGAGRNQAAPATHWQRVRLADRRPHHRALRYRAERHPQ